MTLTEASETDIFRILQEAKNYRAAREQLPRLPPRKLIDLLKDYIGLVLLYGGQLPNIATQRIGNNWYQIGFMSAERLIADIAADLAKVLDETLCKEVIDFHTEILLDSRIAHEYKFAILNAENDSLRPAYDTLLRHLPEVQSIGYLKLRKDFVLDNINNPRPEFTDGDIEALYNLYHFYILSTVRIFISKDRLIDILQYLYEELRNAKHPKIVTDILFDIISYNNLFLLERKEAIKERLADVSDLILENEREAILAALNFSPSDIVLKDLVIQPRDHNLSHIDYEDVTTIISFIVAKPLEESDCRLVVDDEITLEFMKVSNLFDDPIFRFLDELGWRIDGMPLTILSDAIDVESDCTLVSFVIKGFYHPDFSVVNGNIEYADFEEQGALSGRTYYPHKERLIQIIRNLLDDPTRTLPIKLEKREVGINFISNYIVNYVNTEGKSLFFRIYTVTNLDTYLNIKNRYLEGISELNLDDDFLDIRSLQFDTHIVSSRLLCEFICRAIELGVKRPVEFGGLKKLLWDKNKMQKPVSEIDVQPIIRSHLELIFYPKGIQISREVVSSDGSLDFLCSYTRDDQLYRVCVEMKNAHNSRLLHGLTIQLPAYLEDQRTTDGIFLVLWYKDADFQEPTAYCTLDELKERLEENIPANYRIKIMIIDCTKKPPPSKR